MDRLIYLDNAATTRVKPEVFEAVRPYLEAEFANPAGAYTFAGKTMQQVDAARKTVADYLGAKPNEIYFTGGGSESDNWALKGTAYALQNKGKHIITSTFEHHAVLHTCEYLAKQGFEITYVNVDEDGIIKLDELEAAIRPDTILISIMAANNEIGSVQPIAEIGRIAHAHGVLFHTDAVQAYGHMPLNVNDMNIDMLSASGHKIGAPKGIGIFYLRNTARIDSLIHGGSQERGRRAGTHNTPGIIGFAKATEIAVRDMEKDTAYETSLRDHLIERVMAEIPYTKLNGHRTQRLANNTNFSFRYIEGESLLLMLDRMGICGSSGSACTSGSLDPSHVLLAIGLPHEIAHGSLRLTVSADTTMEEIDYTVDKLKQIVERLRSMSPLYEDFVRRNGK